MKDSQTMNLQFFAEEPPTPEPTPAQEVTPAPEPKKAPETKETPAEIMIPKTRFDEVNGKYKELQSKLDELLAEKNDQDRKTKEQQGKFEELYKSTADDLTKHKEQVKTTSNRVQQLEALINGMLEAKLKAVPKEFHDLIPGSMAPEARLEWLTQAESKGFFKSTKREEPVGAATNPGQAQTTDLNKLTPAQLLRAAYGSK
ncbi:hypothetical protein [Heliophilum fasciatum]|uniref:Minor structural protein GP20 n=1 Tax=Heliophilum fasciatum TaxID=35700 RepID=A0A4R2RFW0_9FIRM|nr:hypothetical protein [Heliophilum fasciatum]MCW2278731.1 ribonucleoside-triphosphate reductase [Heliophilum fasciatum]TCP62530.1 hypothetical protein EDD73_12128 [Heliophilum fasciatum]